MPFHCEECGMSFQKLRQLLQHRQTQNHWKKYICSTCGDVFKRKFHRDRHMLRHLSEDQREKYICSRCGKDFSRKFNLDRHILRQHNENKVHCPDSISGIENKNHLFKHENQIEGAAKWPGEEHEASRNQTGEVPKSPCEEDEARHIQTGQATLMPGEEQETRYNQTGQATLMPGEEHEARRNQTLRVDCLSESERFIIEKLFGLTRIQAPSKNGQCLQKQRIINPQETTANLSPNISNVKAKRRNVTSKSSSPISTQESSSNGAPKAEEDHMPVKEQEAACSSHQQKETVRETQRFPCPGEHADMTDTNLDTREIESQPYEPRLDLSNNVVCATSNDSDQPAHTRSLIRPFAGRLNTDSHPDEMTDKRDDTRNIENRPYQCDLCGKRYPKFQTLKTHITDHLQIALRCLQCFAVLKTKGNFQGHLRSHSEEGFTCNICGAHFTHYRIFKRHVRRSEDYFCDLCGQICCYYSDLKTHVAAHLIDSARNVDGNFQKHKRSFSCDICGSIWYNRQHLENHFNTHFEKRNGIFNCIMCDKGYTQRNRIVEHMHAVHFTMGKERRHICQWCGKAFMRRSCLLMHEKSVHVSKGTLYQCDDCGKNFNTKRRLKIHLVTHSDIKKYSCNVCGRKFGHLSSFLRHKKIHTGEKKYSCSYCDFKCIQSYSLKRHILIHTRQKPHECDLCGEQFRQIFALTKHKRKHHSGS